MAQGFICEEADVAGITTPALLAKLITLSASAAAKVQDGFAVANPSGCYWSHLDVVVAVTAGALTGASFVLTWDAAGDNIACIIPAANVSVNAGLTTATNMMITATIDKWPKAPSGYAGGLVHAFMAVVGGGTVTVTRMRLHWRDGHSGG